MILLNSMLPHVISGTVLTVVPEHSTAGPQSAEHKSMCWYQISQYMSAISIYQNIGRKAISATH